jgi:outer membrane protein OmpA-like peptidoglycan-associated protein
VFAAAVLAQLGGCARHPRRDATPNVGDTDSAASPRKAAEPVIRPVEPVIRQAEPAQAAQAEQNLRDQLRRDPQQSLAPAEAGYFLDVMQASLLRMRAEGVQIEREAEQFRLTLAAPMFESGDARVTSEARVRIAAIAEVLNEYRATTVVVHGHSDSSGPPQVNLALSRRRAEAVARILLEHGVARARLLAVGHGATRPRADNATPAGQSANRRVELVLRPVMRAESG